jgi:hypothetical protein
MNAAVLVLLMLAAGALSPQAANTGRLEGTIVIQGSSQPAAEAKVRLDKSTTPGENSPGISFVVH